MRIVKTVLGSAVLSLLLVAATGGAMEQTCGDQSPRLIDPHASPDPYNAKASASMISFYRAGRPLPGMPDTLLYKPRSGAASELHRCGAHYHMPVENVQGCPGETEVIGSIGIPERGPGNPWTYGKVPPIGQWVEIHVVYAKTVQKPCSDPEGLSCCLAGPIVVMAESAKVWQGEGGSSDLFVPADEHNFWHRYAQWSGSSTGAESSPGACKATAAQWSFALGCDFKVGQHTLGQVAPKSAQAARPLQGGKRLSKDLTLVNIR